MDKIIFYLNLFWLILLPSFPILFHLFLYGGAALLRGMRSLIPRTGRKIKSIARDVPRAVEQAVSSAIKKKAENSEPLDFEIQTASLDHGLPDR